MLGFHSDILGVYLSVGDVLRKILRNFGGRGDRECTHDVRVNLLHSVGNGFVAGESIADRHDYASSFPNEMA